MAQKKKHLFSTHVADKADSKRYLNGKRKEYKSKVISNLRLIKFLWLKESSICFPFIDDEHKKVEKRGLWRKKTLILNLCGG